MPNIELIHDDCMNVMAKYPDKHFDLAICDPPYGIGADVKNSAKEMKCRDSASLSKDYGAQIWDNAVPGIKYFVELKRVSKNQIIWGGNYFGCLPECKCFIIWDKLDYGSDFADCEFAWTSFDEGAKIYKQSRQSNQGRESSPRIHPTQKPVKLYRWLLQWFSNKEERIIDTHLGSASSAIAAQQMGFDFVGCEIDLDYYNAACKRFKEQTAQLDIFKP